MHFEILVEGQSERTALEPILSKILGAYGENHTWRIHKHRGIGALPAPLNAKPNPRDPTLLHNLPSKLRAYGKSLSESELVVVLLDLDLRIAATFLAELQVVLDDCEHKPNCQFSLAVEELEAWFLGDRAAVLAAYPSAKADVLDSYVQDSQVGTWEVLAEAIYPGGAVALKKLGIQALEMKRNWAKDIAPKMDVNTNNSPSFCAFRDFLISVSR